MSIQILPYLRVGASVFRGADDIVTPALKILQNGVAQAVPKLPTMHLRGAGHVVSLGPAIVSRRFPEPLATQVPVTFFPHVELVEADLPWRFAPGQPNSADRFDPWLVLAVVERQEGVALRPASQDLPGVLTLRAGLVGELPALAERWAWAHVQTSQDLTKEPPAAPQTFARLIASRRLRPGRRYIAALVPALRAAVQAGLGQSVTADPQELAWSAAMGELVLPVYDAWEFATADEETDFEALAGAIREGKEFPETVGRRRVDVATPGANIPSPGPAATVGYRGPLTPRLVADANDPDTAVVQMLGTGLGSALREDILPLVTADDPVVKLPRYGGKAAPVALQTDVRWRIAAGLGRELVARYQEALVAEVWDQLAEQVAAERRVDRGTLSAEAGETLARRLRALPDLLCMQATARMHGQIMIAGQPVRERLIAELHGGLTSPATRRLLRSGAAAGRSLRAARPDRPPLLTLTHSFVGQQAAVLRFSSPPRRAAPATTTANEIVKTAAAAIKSALHPRVYQAERTQARFAPDQAVPGPGAASRPTPKLQQPLAQWLTALDADLMLPGVADVPQDRVLRIDAEPRFVEALLAGANQALHEELAWRECPIAPGATLFDRFWEGGAEPDIVPLARWKPVLGANGGPSSGPGTTLLIRATLLRLIPNVLVYALDATGAPVTPTRFGRLAVDTMYVGFPLVLTPTKKWWLVLEEASDGLRFGLDAMPSDFIGPKSPTSPLELHWGHLTAPAGTHASPAIQGMKLTNAADVAAWFFQRPIRLTLDASMLVSPHPSP